MPGEIELARYFPKLLETPWRITSPANPKYNCIAWAVGDSTHWWWPSPGEVGYWPFDTELYYDWTCRREGDPWPKPGSGGDA